MLHSLFLVVFPNLRKKSPGSFSFWKLSGDFGISFDYYVLSPRFQWPFTICFSALNSNRFILQLLLQLRMLHFLLSHRYDRFLFQLRLPHRPWKRLLPYCCLTYIQALLYESGACGLHLPQRPLLPGSLTHPPEVLRLSRLRLRSLHS